MVQSSADGQVAQAPTFNDRLLAEAVAVWERENGSPRFSPHHKTWTGTDDFEYRIIRRAQDLAISKPLRSAIRHANATFAWIVAASLVLAFIAGVATARATLGSPTTAEAREPVNFFLTLLAILGLQSLILLAWLSVVLLMSSRRTQDSQDADSHESNRAAVALAAASLGGAIIRVSQRLAKAFHKEPEHAAAVAAVGSVNTRGALGKWTLSAISHSLWLAFNIGCVFMIIVLLSARQYTFAWETTILSEKAYVPLTRAVSWLPDLAGFVVPTKVQIENSQWPASAAGPYAGVEASQAWASLLIGCIVLYGFAPRLLLAALSLGQRRAARSRFRLDTTSADFMKLQPHLMPIAERIGVVDPDRDGPSTISSGERTPGHPRSRPKSTPAIIGLELAQLSFPWPPRNLGISLVDLGIVESGNDRRQALHSLSTSATEPSRIVIVASITTTPDRGIASFLSDLQNAATSPLVLLLTGGQVLRHRQRGAHNLAQRVADWRQLGESVNIEPDRIVEIDLDHLTDATRSQINAAINDDPTNTTASIPGRRLEQAFELIRIDGERWIAENNVDWPAQVDLNRRLSKIFDHDEQSHRRFFRVPAGLGADIPRQIRPSISRVIDLLPVRLQRSPKWLAAGGAAGALSCLAAATLISPVAIASLPMWSAIGAAIAAVIQPAGAPNEPQERSESDVDDAVRAAVLFALLLELQGRGEVVISRVLDQTIVEHDAQPLDSAERLATWLDDLRHRFDLALARESTP